MKKLNIIRKYLSLLLAAVLLFAAGISGAEEESAYPEEEISYPEELQVGHTTVLKGDFFTEMFGNDTADIDVRALIHGYNLVNWDQSQGVYVIDRSVVEDVLVVENGEGDKTYFLTLYEDLYYSDGTPITAWDYAFSLLLMMSPQIEEIGGKIYRAEHILGAADYITGAKTWLSGVGVIDDYQLAITLDHEFLPYFFEPGLLLCVPYPIREIAPGCKVYAGAELDMGDGYGYGVYIGNEDPAQTEPAYTAELLKKTILDPEKGYNSHPQVCSGPYVLTEYEGQTARFEINEYYKGAWLSGGLPEGYAVQEEKETEASEDPEAEETPEGPDIRVFHPEEGDPVYLVKPSIRKITFSLADNDTMAEDLASGKFHLVNKVMYGPTINECVGLNGGAALGEPELLPEEEKSAETEEEAEELPEEETEEASEEETEESTEEEMAEEPGQAAAEETVRFQNYPRIGLAFLTFSCEKPAVREMEVRQAIAWCMDRDTLTEDYCQGYGMVVNGYYGLEQWEHKICVGSLDYPIYREDDEAGGKIPEEVREFENMVAADDAEYEALVEAWDALSLDGLTKYTVDIGKANELLDHAGWTLNREGETFRLGTDDVRCKMVDGELTALDLTMMYPAGNHMAEYMQTSFFDNLAKAGIKITPVPEEMEQLLRVYYREAERTTDMIYLATNFHVVVDPSITYSADQTPNHLIWNNTYSDDEELYQRAVDMRKTAPGSIYEYVCKWIRFQERYNEVLPAIPIYSNVYFDFYTPQLQNYHITENVTWSQAILEAYFGADPAVPEEEETAEDEMMFDE